MKKGEQSYPKLRISGHGQCQNMQQYISTDQTRVCQIKIDLGR